MTARVLYVTAHPDDENNGVLVRLSRGRGLRTALLTLTRGDGGQNEIGPELFDALGVLRTEELAAIHRYDGVEQYFGRAYEFGYSFSVEETFAKWGREATLGDVVRVVRAVPARRDPDPAPRSAGRRPASPGGGAARAGGLPRRRRSRALPEQLGRPAALAGAQDLPGRRRRRRAPREGTAAVSRAHRRLRPAARADLAAVRQRRRAAMHRSQGTSQLMAAPAEGDGVASCSSTASRR